MRFGLLILTLFGATTISATRAPAQEIRSAYRFIDETNSGGVYAGYLFTEPGESGVGPQSAPIIGLRYTTRLSGPLAFDVHVGWSPTEREVMTFDATAGETVGTGQMVDMNLVLIEGGLRFHITGPRTWNNLAPYLTVAGGMATNLASAPELPGIPEEQRFRFGQNFTVGPGIGTDLFLSDRLSLRLEARDHILRMRVPAGLTAAQTAQAFWTNNFAITLGGALHF